MVRDREIRTALGTNQIVGLVTVPAWKKNIFITVDYNVSLFIFGLKDLVSYFIQTLRAKQLQIF